MARRRPATDKIVLVTGGARGIGFATASSLAARGARVVIGDLDARTTHLAAARLGPGATAMELDVTDHAGFTAVIDRVEDEVGPLDVLVNNAGIMPLSMLDDEADATTYRILEVNLAAVIHGTREAMRRMRPRRRGQIVNVASVAGKVGTAGGATYAATKHGVVGLCEAVRAELRGTGVEVSCVLPTIVRTELAAGLGSSLLSSKVGPEDVAAAIVSAVERPRAEIWVPGHLGGLNRVVRALPHSAGEWLLRGSGSDRLLAAAVGHPARADYEARAAVSAPGSERSPGSEPSAARR